MGYILHKEFGRTLSDENVHILDPFTGTGTFITRLLQSGLISREALERKYGALELKPLDNALEIAAHDYMQKRLSEK